MEMKDPVEAFKATHRLYMLAEENSHEEAAAEELLNKMLDSMPAEKQTICLEWVRDTEKKVDAFTDLPAEIPKTESILLYHQAFTRWLDSEPGSPVETVSSFLINTLPQSMTTEELEHVETYHRIIIERAQALERETIGTNKIEEAARKEGVIP